MTLKRLLITVAGTAVLAGLLVVPSALAVPPDRSFSGSGTYGDGTGIVCGSGANAFEIYNSGTLTYQFVSYYDKDGNFVRDTAFRERVGTFSNPLTGASLSYRSNSVTRDVLSVPGDFSSTFTSTSTGQLTITAPGTGLVWQDTGRFVDTFYSDGSETFAMSGPHAHDGFLYGFLGETSVADKLCAALGG